MLLLCVLFPMNCLEPIFPPLMDKNLSQSLLIIGALKISYADNAVTESDRSALFSIQWQSNRFAIVLGLGYFPASINARLRGDDLTKRIGMSFVARRSEYLVYAHLNLCDGLFIRGLTIS